MCMQWSKFSTSWSVWGCICSTLLFSLFFTLPLSLPAIPVSCSVITFMSMQLLSRYDLRNRLTVVTEPPTSGEIPHTVNAVVVVTVIAQVNKLIATLLLTEPTTQPCQWPAPHDAMWNIWWGKANCSSAGWLRRLWRVWNQWVIGEQ